LTSTERLHAGANALSQPSVSGSSLGIDVGITCLYRPGAGGAVVFSGSHLHQALPVTRGKRYVLLSFLFGEGDRRSGSVPVV
jgi:hypothetical protein